MTVVVNGEARDLAPGTTVRALLEALADAAGDEVVEATGARITLNGATVAEFRGDRICAARQYWDELAVYEQIGLLADED